MRGYETLYVVNPDLPDDKLSLLSDKLEKIVKKNKGEVHQLQPWGRRKLAYSIKGFNKGSYILCTYTGNRGTVQELEESLRYNDDVLRFLSVKLSDTFDPKKHVYQKQREEDE